MVRLAWLRACCAVAEGAEVTDPPPDAATAASCVAVVLTDPLHRVSVIGGREGMPRSLGSVYGGSVTRFLGGLCPAACRVIPTPGVTSHNNGVCVSTDGCTLLLSHCSYSDARKLHVFRVADGELLRSVGSRGRGPLHFFEPRQVWVAPDGFVFVADWPNHCVQVLTPDLRFHGFVGACDLESPVGVCADAAVVVVSERVSHRLSFFHRGDGTLFNRVESESTLDDDGSPGLLTFPCGLCFVHSGRHVAVAVSGSNRVSVFAMDGSLVRHVGAGVLKRPTGVACSAFDEIVVADAGNRCVRVFSDADELLMSFGVGGFTGVAVGGSTVFAADADAKECLVWT
jgi:hypothetical protein